MADINQQTQEAMGWSAEGKKLAVDIPEVSFKDAATFVAEMTPIVGDAMAAKEVYDELQKDEPNYYLAGALGGATLIGLIPGVGDIAAKAIRKGAKEVFDVAKRVEVDPNAMGSGLGNVSLKPKDSVIKANPSEPDPTRFTPMRDIGVNKQVSNIEFDARIAELDEATDVSTWQANTKSFVKESRDVNPSIRTPELENSTKDLLDGKITREQHLKNIDEYKPVNAWDAMPREPSDKAVVFSLDDAQRKDGHFVLDSTSSMDVNKSSLKIGDLFNGRLDIPAYNRYDTWVVTGSSATAEKGKHYAKAVHYTAGEGKPVKFIASVKTGEKIGTGEKGKTPYATVQGYVKDLDADAIRSKATDYLNDPEWTQVGFDPRRQGGFYVRAGENKHVPIREASEVIQIGPLILAKNAKLDFEYSGYNKGGLTMHDQTVRAFAIGGLAETVDPVSGNDVPPGSLPAEVRDDVPAQLSEGEYVVPADVVRYFGVKAFEDMRMQAKQGMSQMDSEGRIGGDPMQEEALPFSDEELMTVDTPEDDTMAMMNEGGVVYAANGIDIPTGVVVDNPYGSDYGMDPNDPTQVAIGMQGGLSGSGYEYKTFYNAAGLTVVIPFFNGVAQAAIPEGYASEAPKAEVAPSSVEGGYDDEPPETPKAIEWGTASVDQFTKMHKSMSGKAGRSMIAGVSVLNPVFGLGMAGMMKVQRNSMLKGAKSQLENNKNLTPAEKIKLTKIVEEIESGGGGIADTILSKETYAGNSFTEGLANLFTPNDGASYVNGQLVDDKTQKPILPGTIIDGKEIKGTMNSKGNDNNDGGGGGNNDGPPTSNTPSSSATTEQIAAAEALSTEIQEAAGTDYTADSDDDEFDNQVEADAAFYKKGGLVQRPKKKKKNK